MIPMKKLLRVRIRRICSSTNQGSDVKQVMGVSWGAPICCIQVLVLCVIVCLLYSSAQAAGRVISLQGGCIAPSAPSDSIRLEEMNVTFRSKRDSYSVDAYYHLFNTDKTTTVKVGVPKYGRPDRDEPIYVGKPIVRDFINFEAWVNGNELKFIEADDFFTAPILRPIGGYCLQGSSPTETRWMTKLVTFPGKAMTTIRIRYEAYYKNHYWHSGQLLDSGYYHDSVGRHWKGNVRRAFFITDTGDIKEDTHGKVNDLIYGIKRLAAPTNFISVNEVRYWEPSSGSFVQIPGSYKAANWRARGTVFHGIGPGRKHPVAPTPCSFEKWW